MHIADVKELVVIGGGWAGISAAMRGIEDGWKVTLVEERPYLGGRARSFIDRTTGERIDNGQHLLVGAYYETLSILESLGTLNLLKKQSALNVPFVDQAHGFDVLDAYSMPGRLGVAKGIWKLRHISLAGRLAILRLALRLQLKMVDPSGRTCLQFLQYENQPPDAIMRFWEPIILATLNAPMDKAAAVLLVQVMRLAFLGSKDDGALFFPRVGLSDLIAPFQGHLESRGGRVLTSTPADRLVVSAGRVAGVELRDGSVIDVDSVVTAMPQRATLRLFKASGIEAPRMTITEFSPIVSVYLWYNMNWMTEELAAALGTVVQWVFNRRSIADVENEETQLRYPGHVSLTISAGSALAKKEAEEIILECDTELRLLFPHMRDVVLEHGIVIKEKMATPLITPDVERPSIQRDQTIDN